MARFIFQLAGVLRHRKHLEREKQRVVAERQAVVTQLTRELREMDQQLQGATNDLKQNRLTGQLDLSFIAAHRRYAISMQRRAIDQARRIAAAQQLVEQARAELVAAARDRKVIEKLRERRHEQWRAEQQRKEEMLMDEVGMQMAQMNENDE
jgi:flagellar FliJ protein